MPAIINHKICDQSPACGGMSICPVKAFKYNAKKKQIEIDEKKCTSCGLCVSDCPIGAIGCGKTEAEMIKLKKIIEDDPRDPKDLFVDRFGADIITKKIVISASDVTTKTAKGRVLVEFLDESSINCLIKSIPVSEIISAAKANAYFRVFVTGADIKKFKKISYPNLWLFENGKLLKVLPYTEESKKQELFKELK